MFLLTDVEGSTARWEADPEAMERDLELHDAAIEAVITRHGGHLIKSKGEGDSTFSVFSDADAGARAAVDLQRELARSGAHLRVRAGLHTGEAQCRGGDYFGTVVNRAGRVRGRAAGGQTLVSAGFVEAVGDRLPLGAWLVDQGEHELKGLVLPERLHTLAHPDLPVPELLAAVAPAPSNLPTALDRFVGRDDERTALDKALGIHRLVTVTGAGGTGKTRLVREVAGTLLGTSPGGVWLVELGPLTDDAQVPAATAAACRVEVEDDDPLAAVAGALADRPAVIVLDTCEVALDDAASAAVKLLRTCPGLRVLATSRTPLDADGEAVLRLDPLDTDDAVELFLRRAAAADLGFVPSASNLELVRTVCGAIDNLPLAVELAAARLSSTSIEDVAAGIGDRLASLAAGRRTAPSRQRTLRATIEWIDDLEGGHRHRLLDTIRELASERLDQAAKPGWSPTATAMEAAAARRSGDLREAAAITDEAVRVARSICSAELLTGLLLDVARLRAYVGDQAGAMAATEEAAALDGAGVLANNRRLSRWIWPSLRATAGWHGRTSTACPRPSPRGAGLPPPRACSWPRDPSRTPSSSSHR